MAGAFNIPLANPFRWRLKSLITDARYNSVSFDDEDDGRFSQPWQLSDTAITQILSDFEAEMKVYDCLTDAEVLTVAFIEQPLTIVDVTFKCYQSTLVMSDLPEGEYYAEITYNDGVNEIVYISNCFNVADYQTDTIYIEAKNTINDKGAIFETTNYVVNIRVPGARNRRYLPKTSSETYEDQKYNPTQENSIPYRNFTIFIGPIVPNWIIDKCNILFSLDQKSVDGDYYERAEAGANFEVGERPENGKDESGWWSIAVQPTDNTLKDYQTKPNSGDEEYIVVRKDKEYLNQIGNFAATGLFTDKSVLDYFKIINKDLVGITLLVGTTNGGSEIGTFNLSDDLTQVVSVRYPFDSAANVYFTGLTGRNTDITVVYDQLDAKPANIPPAGSGGFVVGTLYWYREYASGDFVIHWDAATGLGRVGTAYENCQMVDDLANATVTGWERITNPTLRQTFVGANSVEILRENLPDEPLKVPDLRVNTSYHTGGNSQFAAANGTSNPQAYTENMGDGVLLNVRNYSQILVPFIKLP